MAGLLELLMQRAQTPLMSEETMKQRMQTVDPGPSLERSPMEARLRGFGAGMQEGLRGLSSPLNIATSLTAPLGMGAGMRGAAMGAKGLAAMAPEVVPAARAVKQVVPMADDVTKMASQLKGRLSQIPTGSKVAKPLGEVAPEFTPRGGEAALNAVREAAKGRTPDLNESVYRQVLASRGGRMGSEVGEVNPNLVIGGMGALGAAALAKKLYDALQGIKSPLSNFNQQANPMERAKTILEQAAERNKQSR